jgi:hypothetical protein
VTHSIFQKTSDIPNKDWEQVLVAYNLYLSIPYLKVLEETLQGQVSLFFCVSYQHGVPALITAFQLVTFVDSREQTRSSFLKLFSETKSKRHPFKMNMLVCGNVFADGEHGFVATKAISQEEVIVELVAISKEIEKRFSPHKKISVSLFKEFWPSSVVMMDGLLASRFKGFNIDVNMVLDIHASWNTFDDYLLSMKTKFRTKANSAYKRSKDVEMQSFSSSEINTNSETIDILLANVLDKSEYSFGRMDASVFAELKKNLKDDFSFMGVYLENKLVGFSIAYFHKNIIEAGFVGLDYTLNVDYAIYQRILYNYVEQAIERKASQLQLGRTSELIKSALGARPVDMKLYAKHKRPLTNLIMGAVLNKVTPSDYELRRPFKSGFEV